MTIKYFRLAQSVAQIFSKDPSSKMGAVVVAAHSKKRLAIGYNGFPPGIADTEERLNDRDKKYPLMQHAERNALDNATFDVDGGTIYCTGYPCSECAKSIISKGLQCVVCPPRPEPDPNRPWTVSTALSAEMFAEVGVKVVEMK